MARLLADLELAHGLLCAGMDPYWVDQYYFAVRMYGGLYWAGGDSPGTSFHPPGRLEGP